MNIYKKIVLTGVAILTSLSFALPVFAATPTLSLSNINGDVVQVRVTNADPNMNVSFYFNVGSASGMQVTTLGNTDSSGYFSSNVSSASYNVAAGSLVYVAVNGQQSTVMTWPYTSNNGSAPPLSQTSLTLTVNQTATITTYSNGTSLYISNNTNPSVASFTVNSSTQISVIGNSVGSTVATICYSGNNSNCTSVYVTVQGSGSQSIYFSQSNPTLVSGQTLFVTASGGNGNYYISANSNSGAITASISGSQITLYGTGTSGSATITVCTDGSTCGYLYVTNGSGSNNGSVTFSQTNISMTSGQNQTVTIYGSGNYTMTNNTNANVVSTTVSGSTLTLYAIATGSANITICQSGTSQCGVLYVTVNSSGNTGGAITFSQTNPNLSIGQTMSVTLFGGSGSYYLSGYSTNGVTSASISGNTLTLVGLNSGSSSLQICSSGSTCTTLYVTVGNGSGNTGTLSLSQSNVTLAMGQSTTAFITGGNGYNSYYISGSQNTSIASVSLSGSTLTITGINPGTTTVSICQNSGQCATLFITVTSGTTNNSATIASLIAQIANLQAQLAVLQGTQGGGSNGGTPTGYIFENPIRLGDSGTDVIELQKRLADEGYFSGSITGYFGPVTLAAVKRFQAANGLSPIGSVGPGTRMALNS